MSSNDLNWLEKTVDYIQKINLPFIEYKLKKNNNDNLKNLLKNGVDFTRLARLGKFDPCFGRESELTKLMEILARRQKGNPVLLGDPGVGKSAIIEHFANQIVANLVPFILQGRTIISLDLVQIVAGSSHRGDFESKLNNIIREVLLNPHIILFIDEIHILSGAGSIDGNSGGMDAANILKPYLSRGSLQCIGASTRGEYENRIQKDSALSRRFQPIYIKESSADTALKILYNLRPTLESYHNVILHPLTLKFAVDLSIRYIHDRFLPDKAIDLVDQISAKEAISQTDIQKVSLIRGIVNSLSNTLEKLRLEAFRKGDIVTQYIFQEINSTYKHFIIKWFENPLLFNNSKPLQVSSISETLLDQLKLLIFQNTEKFLFLSFKDKIKKIKLNNLVFLYNQNLIIFKKLINSNLLKKKLKLNLYRIFIFIYFLKSMKNSNLKMMQSKIQYFSYIYLNKLKNKLNDQKYLKQDILKCDYKMQIIENVLISTSLKERNNFKLKLLNFNLDFIKPLIKKSNISILKQIPNLDLLVNEKDIFFNILNNKILKEENNINNENDTRKEITATHLINSLAQTMNVPLENISEDESTKLLNLENALHEKVIGQEDAISSIAKAIRRSRLGLQSIDRPIASFLFCGPTGVGKTEIVKTLAYIMFGSEKSIIRFDMSEFMEKHSISRLIGSPPGYVGYENGGELTDNVRRNPYSIVLFDEAEKAHPDVLNILLQILEDGRLTDSQKRLISFENTIIVLTSNAAAGEIQNILTKKEMLENGLTDKSNNENSTTFIKEIIQETISYGALNFLKSPISFNYNDDLRKKLHNILNYSLSYYKNTKENTINTKSLKSLVIEKLSAIFLPEFINRFDDIIIFRPLTVEQLRKISIIMIDKVIQKAKIKNVNLIVEDNVKLKLARDAYNPIFGARPLRRAITKNVEDRVSEVLLSYNSKNEKIAIKFSLSSLGEINITHYLE